MPKLAAIAHTHSPWIVLAPSATADLLTRYPPMPAMLLWRSVPHKIARCKVKLKQNYERKLHTVIVENFHEQELGPFTVPGVLV